MKPTILLTASDPLTRRDVSDVLARFGYETVTASDATEGFCQGSRQQVSPELG
jgi:CheY-like chemotaxis protein